MALALEDCTFFGPALPEPFVKFELEKELNKRKLLPKARGKESKELQQVWVRYRRKLRKLASRGGPARVCGHVIEPLMPLLGYASIERQEEVKTRESLEDGGYLLRAADDTKLRVWTFEVGADLDAPNRRGRAYRFSPSRVAQRVLLAEGERVGLLTDGEELRILLCDPARPDSQIVIRLDRGSGGWRGAQHVPDSLRLLVALACPGGVEAIDELADKARLSQTQVTKELRKQAREAIESFVQNVLEHPDNQSVLSHYKQLDELAPLLWHDSLTMVYRLLFIFKLETSADPARAFSFASTSLWRNTYSPNTALARHARRVIDEGAETGDLLEEGLRTTFRLFVDGIKSRELTVTPLGGMLFDPESTPFLDRLKWGEQAVASLLDKLLWTPGGRSERQRVHYGSLDVEDLGRVYEALLELEPGIATEDMCRLRRARLEVVVPLAQGKPYRDKAGKKSAKTAVEWIEDVPRGDFFLRVGLGRKASGSYYTPHPFVRFLVQETIGPLVEKRSPTEDPNPCGMLELNILDPAMGSGHFLVEACRYLGEKLYEACRACDERALECEATAEKQTDSAARKRILARAADYRQRVIDLPDPDDEIVDYMPSRAPEGEEVGLSQHKAEALCRRLVAVHCLYGADKNPLAVELAKLSLWLESYAEGLPLTFLDHRLMCGDSLTGAQVDHLLTYPVSGGRLDGLLTKGLTSRLQAQLRDALTDFERLQHSIGIDSNDLDEKRAVSSRAQGRLGQFRQLATAWVTGVALEQSRGFDTEYVSLVRSVTAKDQDGRSTAPPLLDGARDALHYELQFPEVFYGQSDSEHGAGFDVVLGNPPWEGIDTSRKEFFAGFDIAILDAATLEEEERIIQPLMSVASVARAHSEYVQMVETYKRTARRFFQFVNQGAETASGATPDFYQGFTERSFQLLKTGGRLGLVLPSAVHANEGASGLRRLLIDQMKLLSCFSFENRKKIFDIDSRMKFATVVAERSTERTNSFQCAFYRHDEEWLFSENDRDGLLQYTPEFIQRTAGELGNLLELRLAEHVPVAERMYAGRSELFGEFRRRVNVLPTEEIHKSKNKRRLVLSETIYGAEDPRDLPARDSRRQHYLPFFEGRCFEQYTDLWGDGPEFCIPLENLRGKEKRVAASRYYRLAFRTIASATNERTAIFTILPPGVVCSHSALPESVPELRPLANALLTVGLCNSFAFDWLLRLAVGSNVTFNFLDAVPVPPLADISAFVIHATARLVSNHAGFDALWQHIFCDQWLEASPRKSWPAVAGPTERLGVRAHVDALVAHCYGLTRAEYECILGGFSHSSAPELREMCGSAHDEIAELGLDVFVAKHDPYSTSPIPTILAKPSMEYGPSSPLAPSKKGQVDIPAQGRLFKGGKASQ